MHDNVKFRHLRPGQKRSGGFSTLAIAFVLLALTIPIVFIAESVLVAGRQAASSALGQENLRAVDAAMNTAIGDVRLDPGSVDGCQERTDPSLPASANKTFNISVPRPTQGDIDVTVKCSVEAAPVGERILTFKAFFGPQSNLILRGKARAHIFDRSGSEPEPGVDMLICDWRLGKDTAPLDDC